MFCKVGVLRLIALEEQPLYVDADTLKFNVDSSGLVKDVMRSSDSVYIKIDGVWEFAFIDSVGSGGGGGRKC